MAVPAVFGVIIKYIMKLTPGFIPWVLDVPRHILRFYNDSSVSRISVISLSDISYCTVPAV